MFARSSRSVMNVGCDAHEPPLSRARPRPRLLNVVRGKMSLVGPRPDVPYSVEAYAPCALRRLEVQPGVTGPWQVSGPSKLSIQDMLRLDITYVDRCSLRLDLAILLRTIPAVISRSGAA